VKSIEVLHTSFSVYAGVLAVAVVVVAVLAVTSPGARRLMPRLGKCATVGALAAAALVAFVDTKRHAQLVKQAARPVSGHHVTVAYLLANGFAAAFLAVTVVTFTIVTLAARRPPAPRPVTDRPRAGAGTWRS
jgi:heme O synthase-like polyprenyltransferase